MNKPQLVLTALKYIGQKAMPGQESNSAILKFFKSSGHPEITEDEIPWCSAFMNAIITECGGSPTNQLNARSWLKFGRKTTTPELGDIAVFWRVARSSWQGHVGFVIRVEGAIVWVLGGNQDNQVEIKAYSTENILDYRSI